MNGDGEDEYERFTGRKIIFLMAIGVLIIAVALYSAISGAYSLTVGEVIDVIFGGGDTTSRSVVWNIRMPRIIGAVIVGAALGVAGCVMQCVLKNPLASPYTLGISNAAAFGAALSLAISYFGFFQSNIIGELLSGVYGMAIGAFAMSMIAVCVVLSLSRLVSATPENMILTGVAMGAIFSAALSSLQYFVDDDTLASMVYWQFGDLSKVNTEKLLLMVGALIATAAYFMHKRWDYNAIEVGEDVSRSLGVNTKATLLITMTLSSAVTAVCISIVGIIGFVGLLAPHIVRRTIGSDHRFLIPGSMLMGSAVLIVADTVGRLAFEIAFPVGIITSFLGGPLFVFILSRGKKRESV